MSKAAAILHLASPLPASVAPLAVGEGDSYTIAGYGTSNEARRDAIGTLREAKLIVAEARALVDPTRYTGMSRDELLSGLSRELPRAIDDMTPDGRLPTADEASRWI